MSKDDDIKQLRSNLSLDFKLGPSQSKKIKFENCVLETPDFAKITFSEANLGPHAKKMKYENCILGTPDMAKIALTTPELDQMAFRIQNPALNTFSRNDDLDEDKPKIAEIWANISAKSIKNEEMPPEYKYIPPRMLDDKLSNEQLSISQDQLEPIDMADQERIKLERKRHRNRIAASKCRQRKLERISKLQDRVSRLAAKNDELAAFLSTVQNIVSRLNNHIITHKEMGCDIHC